MVPAYKRIVLLFFGLIALLLTTSLPFFLPIAQAAGAQVILSGTTSGPAGTAFHADGSGLTPDGIYNLYATTDAAHCAPGDPGTLGLQVFSPATVTVSGGTFAQDLQWPAAINQPGQYFLCIVPSIAVIGPKTASSNAFTLTGAPTPTPTPSPTQQPTPTPTPTQQPTPTPTPTQQATPTPTPTQQAAPTPTPTPTSNAQSGTGTPNSPEGGTGNSRLNLIIFGMAGLGILFIVIGAVIFAVSTQAGNS